MNKETKDIVNVKPSTNLIGILKVISLILLVIGLGLFALNGGIDYIYKAKFLNTPCELCKEYQDVHKAEQLELAIDNANEKMRKEFENFSADKLLN